MPARLRGSRAQCRARARSVVSRVGLRMCAFDGVRQGYMRRENPVAPLVASLVFLLLSLLHCIVRGSSSFAMSHAEMPSSLFTSTFQTPSLLLLCLYLYIRIWVNLSSSASVVIRHLVATSSRSPLGVLVHGLQPPSISSSSIVAVIDMGMVVVTWLELRFRMRLAVPPLRRHVGLRLVRPRVVGVWPRWMSGPMGPSDVVGAGEGRWR